MNVCRGSRLQWFDLPRFWLRAAQVLKPGGTVALWTVCKPSTDPSVPNAEAIKARLQEIEVEYLRPFIEPGNRMVRDKYASLPLPWTLPQPVADFDEATFFRKDSGWGQGQEFTIGQGHKIGMDMAEKILGTASPVTRWREAHPDAVGTEADVVRVMRREIERLLHEAGVEVGQEYVKVGVEAVLLMIKKKA